MTKRISRIGARERRYVAEVLDAEFKTSAGNMMTKRLEQEFAARFGVKYAISFINGTATIHAALASMGVGREDEVIVPPLTMASTSLAVLQVGAIPVFADVDRETWTIDPKSVERLISPKTRAIVPVALYGLPADLGELMKIAEEHDLMVLEDDAQAPLACLRDKMLGGIGHAASFSFQSSKHMTSGEGGMITTNDDDIADRARKFGSLGYASVGGAPGTGKIGKELIQDPKYERHVSLGWNYRMPELCAAVALGQLQRLDEFVMMRREIAKLYSEAIDGFNWLKPQKVPSGYSHSYWTYVVEIQTQEPDWYEFRKKYVELGGDGIYSAWQLTYLEPVFRGRTLAPGQRQKYEEGLCPIAESIQPKLLQFKTNYFDIDEARTKSETLRRTAAFFDSKLD